MSKIVPGEGGEIKSSGWRRNQLCTAKGDTKLSTWDNRQELFLKRTRACYALVIWSDVAAKKLLKGSGGKGKILLLSEKWIIWGMSLLLYFYLIAFLSVSIS